MILKLKVRAPRSQLYAVISIILVFLIFFFHDFGGDNLIANFFYDSSTQSWPYRNNFWFETILHKGGIKLAILLDVLIIGYSVYSLIIKKNSKLFIEGLFILIGLGVSSSIIYFIKQNARLPCPWSLTLFGGDQIHLKLAQIFDSNFNPAYCYPAGHSSAFFPYLSWFFIKDIQAEAKVMHILPGAVMGFLFGFSQQARGAHFFSHDLSTLLITLIICWALSWLLYFWNTKCDIGFK